MALFGNCMIGRHKDCQQEIQKWYFGPKKQGRKTVEAIIYLDEYWTCDCKCHRKGKK